jgi:hypothetical protein
VTYENAGLEACIDGKDALDDGEYIGWEYRPTESVDVN